MNAWPAAQQILYDGWIVRFANGYTRRANSVNPIYEGERGIYEKVLRCEQLYRDRGLPVVFKMMPLTHPPDLDLLLEGRGYEKEAGTSVQALDLRDLEIPSLGSVQIRESVDANWMEAYAQMKGMSDSEGKASQGILSHIGPPAQYVSLLDGETPVAMGISVLEDDYVGLFGLVTDASRRNQGFGTQLVWAILGNARANGARTAYLQVEITNDPALRLYIRLGFEEVYRYWYRVK